MTHPLDGAFEKVRRAKVHRDSLSRSIERLRKRYPVPLRSEFDPDTGYYLLRIAKRPRLPLLRWGVMIGDVIHNLRSALDYVAWQLAHEGGRIPDRPRSVQFPIIDDPADFPGSYLLGVIDSAHVPRIERHQPYNTLQGPDHWFGPYIHPLALVRDLSNDDKHRLVTPILARSQSFTLSNVGELVDFGDSLSAFERDTIVMRVRPVAGAPPGYPEPTGNMAPDVLLPEGRGLIPMLDRSAAYVLRILREFEPLL